MNRRRLASLLGALTLLTACSSTGGGAGASQASVAPSAATSEPTSVESQPEVSTPGEPEATTLRVMGSDPDFTQIALFKAAADMAEKGVTVELMSSDDSDVSTRALVAGHVDIAVTFPFYAINARKADVPIKMIVADAQTNDYLMITPSDITSLDDLVGKTIGINKPGDLGSTVVDQCLRGADIDPDQIERVQVGGTGARLAALLAGQVQGGVAHVAEALSAIAESDGALRVTANCGQVTGSFLQTGALATDDWLAANPNLAQLWVDTYIDALRWAAENKDEYIALSQEKLPEIDDAIRGDAYDMLLEGDLFAVDGGLDEDSVSRIEQIGLESDAFDEPVPEDWYTLEFIESYLARNAES